MRLTRWINRRNLFILFRIQVPEISKREHKKVEEWIYCKLEAEVGLVMVPSDHIEIRIQIWGYCQRKKKTKKYKKKEKNM